MLARDLIESLPQEPPNRLVRDVVPWLCRGIAVVIVDDTGWRYVRPLDGLAAPPTRQLRDVRSHPLPTVDVDATVEATELSSRELLGVTDGELLLGGIDCARVLAESAKLTAGDSTAALALAVRERLMPKFLHDLANVLMVTAGFVDQDRTTDGEMLREARHALSHATTLVHRMRLVHASAPMPESSFDLVELLRELEPTLRMAATPASLELKILSAPLATKGAAWRLERVLLNLVLNASEAGSSRVQVQLGSDIAEQARIDVDDDGPGLPAEDSHREGLRGHGLEIMQRQVGLLGGQAEVGSSPLGGARIHLRLPLRG